MALDHSLRPDQLLLDPGQRRGRLRLRGSRPLRRRIRRSARRAHDPLCARNAAAFRGAAPGDRPGRRHAGAGGGRGQDRDPGSSLVHDGARGPRAAHPTGSGPRSPRRGQRIITGICWMRWRRCASPCGGRRRICICTAWSASASSRCWRPLNAAYRHLSWAGKALPGFEVLSFDQACCAPQQPVTPHTQAGRKAS